MPGFAKAGLAVPNNSNLKLQGASPVGIAYNNNVIYRGQPQWQLLNRVTAYTGYASVVTVPMDTTGARLIIAFITESTNHTNPDAEFWFIDSMNNTWQSLRVPYIGSGINSTVEVDILYCINPITSTAHTFTCNGQYLAFAVDAFNAPVTTQYDTWSVAGGFINAVQDTHMPSIPLHRNSIVFTAIASNPNMVISGIDSGFTIVAPPFGTNYTFWIAVAVLESNLAIQVAPTWGIASLGTLQTTAAMVSFRPF